MLFASGPVHRPVGVWSALLVTLSVAACDDWSLFLSQHATISHSFCYSMRSLIALSVTACDSDGVKQIRFTVYMVLPLLRFAVTAALCTLIVLWLFPVFLAGLVTVVGVGCTLWGAYSLVDRQATAAALRPA